MRMPKGLLSFLHVIIALMPKSMKSELLRSIRNTNDDNYKSAALVKEPYVENAVDALLAGNHVPEKETKNIGCSIKTK